MVIKENERFFTIYLGVQRAGVCVSLTFDDPFVHCCQIVMKCLNVVNNANKRVDQWGRRMLRTDRNNDPIDVHDVSRRIGWIQFEKHWGERYSRPLFDFIEVGK